MRRHAEKASITAPSILGAVKTWDAAAARGLLDEVCSSLLELTRGEITLAGAAESGRELLLATYGRATPYICDAMRLLPAEVERFIVEVEMAQALRAERLATSTRR